jgi:hypothetical protein
MLKKKRKGKKRKAGGINTVMFPDVLRDYSPNAA